MVAPFLPTNARDMAAVVAAGRHVVGCLRFRARAKPQAPQYIEVGHFVRNRMIAIEGSGYDVESSDMYGAA
jgi:hypothetical protein